MTKEAEKVIAHELGYLRKLCDVRSADLARALFVPESHVLAIEAGEMPLPHSYVDHVHNALNAIATDD